MTEQAETPPGMLKKAGYVLLALIMLPLMVWGLWRGVLGMTYPLAYAFGHTAPGQVLSTSTWRMSRSVRVQYQDATAVDHTVKVDVLEFFSGELVPGAVVTVHYFPWLTSSPCLNGHWFAGLYTFLIWIVLAIGGLILPFVLLSKLTAKRTAV